MSQPVDRHVTPLFVFSQPRSGSTLLQRILATQKEVATVAEPWLLLPLLYALKDDGLYAEYSHGDAYLALQDFLNELPNGEQDYLDAISLVMQTLYGKIAKDSDSKYFLDKTPRYTLVANQIMRAAPEGKFIFLWRNPLAVMASMMETWGGGKWNLFYYKIDLYKGMESMLAAYQTNKDIALSVSYESLIDNPEGELLRIGDYLGLVITEKSLDAFGSVSFKGKMGDPTGVKNYSRLSDQPFSKWKAQICNPWRKWWCKRYLNWLGHDKLQIMGYDLSSLLTELEEVPLGYKYFLSDLFRAAYGVIYCSASLTILRKKWQQMPEWKRVVNHL